MISEEVSALLLSLGGSAAVLLAFAKVLEKILIDQVSKRTAASLNQELEILKSKHTTALEEFKAKSNASIKERESFNTISIDTYQDFFKKRISTYQSLLDWENEYTKDMLEDFLAEHTDSFGDRYFYAYKGLREILIKNQMYISNDLDQKFQKLRHAAAEHTKKADYHEAMSESHGVDPQDYMQDISDIYHDLGTGTSEIMNDILQQIAKDVSKIRSRIEIDQA
ncbi:hypothetical protein [Shewanella indica]|uniref:hypothetical protein n=1 Tax=Shewanella indica TaxID=768528 RepID=UPI00399999E7